MKLIRKTVRNKRERQGYKSGKVWHVRTGSENLAKERGKQWSELAGEREQSYNQGSPSFKKEGVFRLGNALELSKG